MNVTATDADVPAQTITFAIVGGADQSRFTIAPNGALSFVSPPDFESPADADGNNIYVVTIEVSDGSLIASQTIQVSIIDVSENVAGDYNRNGVVDAADYVLWRKAEGTVVPPSSGADGNGDGTVDANDYGVWRTNFGRTLPARSAAAASGAAAIDVPTPNGNQADVRPTVAAPVVEVGLAGIGNQFSSTSAIVSETVRGLNTSARSERSNSTAVISLRDNAILSWLRDRSGARPNRFDADPDDGDAQQNENEAPLNHLFDEFDQVFASVGTFGRQAVVKSEIQQTA